MYPENVPIIFKTPKDFDHIVIYPIHDPHFGNECFDQQKYKMLVDEVLSEPNHYVIWVGDLMENAIPNSKSDVFTQTLSPQEQKDLVVEQFKLLGDRTIAIVAGNHEYNRTTRHVGLYPLYDCAVIAGIGDRYRNAYAVTDIYVGLGKEKNKKRQHEYVGYVTHQISELKKFGFADVLEGFDFLLCGHDHEPKDRPRMKISYNRQRKQVEFKSIDVINCGSFLTYGGYGARGPYRPLSDKYYKLVLEGGFGKESTIQTVGYYLHNSDPT